MLAGTGSDVDNRRGEESAARDTTDSQKIRQVSSLGRYVFGSEISYNKPPPRLPGLGC